MRPQSRCKHIAYYKPINYLVIDKILTCPTFLVHLKHPKTQYLEENQTT